MALDRLSRSLPGKAAPRISQYILFTVLICFGVVVHVVGQNTSGEKTLNQIDPSKIESIKQQAPGDLLSTGQVQDAITVGSLDKNKSGADIGLTLEDSGQKFSNAMSQMG